MAWRRRERESEMEWENRRYPWGGRQFSYSDWLIAQSCQEQEGTGHQESEEKWLELWVRRKKGQLLFISIERTTYVVWENRFGEESALVRKTASLFFSSRLFSSCQTWWKVHTIFAETLRQVSYYTTIVLKTRWTTQFFSNPPVHVFLFFPAILSAYVYVGYFANTKVHGYVIILNDSCQNLAVCRTGAREGQSTGGERGSPKSSGQLPTPSLDAMFSLHFFSRLPSRK